MVNVEYRHAKPEDFFTLNNLIRTAFDGLLKEHGFDNISPFASSRLPPVPLTGPFPWFDLGLVEDRDGFWVAEINNEIAGLAYSWVRDSLWYLAHLFVLPQYQGRDIGRNLMDRVMEHGKHVNITNRALVTLAYNPVSISLYSRYGIFPREPLYYMEGPSENIAVSNSQELKAEKIVNFENNRKIITSIDEQCIGFLRDKNHEFLNSSSTIKCYIFKSHNQPVGYAYVTQAGRVGPVAVTSNKWFVLVVKYALELAASEKNSTVSVTVTGSNNVMMKLAFDYGMKIRDNFLFMSSKPFPNFENYIIYPTGAML
jgi:GNAT superfamily N-acetyltransferase